MYDIKNKQFVFRQSKGTLLNFFYDERSGLCCSVLTKRGEFTEPILLQKNLQTYYYIDMDRNDIFHIVFQDSQGNIHYSYMDREDIKTIPILNSKAKTLYDKQLYLVHLKDKTHFFFVLEHNDTIFLTHQTYTNGKINPPSVVDYVVRNENSFVAIQDKQGNIYTFYQSSDGKYLQLGYKKYIQSQNFWGEFTPITKYRGDCEIPRVIVDKNNVIHMSYQRRGDKYYELIYQQKQPDKNIWSGEVIISFSPQTFMNSSIFIQDKKTYIYWLRDEVIYYCVTSDNGKAWTKPNRYNQLYGKNLECIVYRTNSQYEIDKIIMHTIPGSFKDGFRMAFYHDEGHTMSSKSIENSNDEYSITIVDSLNHLKQGMEELNSTCRKLSNEITNLKEIQQEFKKDIEKQSIYARMIKDNFYKDERDTFYGDKEKTDYSSYINSFKFWDKEYRLKKVKKGKRFFRIYTVDKSY